VQSRPLKASIVNILLFVTEGVCRHCPRNLLDSVVVMLVLLLVLLLLLLLLPLLRIMPMVLMFR